MLTWGYDNFDETEGVTTDETIAMKWEKCFGRCIKVDLIENDEQYEEFLNT